MKIPSISGKTASQAFKEVIAFLRASRITSVCGGRLQESPNGTTLIIDQQPTQKTSGKLSPFTVSLIKEDDGETVAYYVTVSEGTVSEVIPGIEDPPKIANNTYKPFNLFWGDDAVAPDTATTLRRHEINIGDQVAIAVYQDEEGAFGGDLAPEGGPVQIVTEVMESNEDVVSAHYSPPGGDDQTGISGVLHFRLAVLRPSDELHENAWLENYLAGSNIYLYRDLPMLENTSSEAADGAGRVFQKYKADANKYMFRTLTKGAGQLNVNELGDEIEVRGNEKSPKLIFMQETDASPTEAGSFSFNDGLADEDEDVTITLPRAATGGNLDLTVIPFAETTDGFLFESGTRSVLAWRNGLYIGKFASGSQPTGTAVDTESVAQFNPSS